jgi:hypothetical protein
MTDFSLNTPVALIIFNRPDTTQKVFDEIAKARPPKLLVVGDGARSNRPGEAERVAAARAIIQQVNWPCEVLCNFSDRNLGCKARVSSGLDWVFEQVPEAIILEDDCLPDPSFFRFCEELLEKYREDRRVGMISGDNFQFGRKYNEDSYYFSKYIHIWGWATWRDRWVGTYDVNLSSWPHVRDSGGLAKLIENKKEAAVWTHIFNEVHLGKIDTWDHQWAYANWVNGRCGILPTVNLISNIGFGADATHTVRTSHLASLPRYTVDFPLLHPREFRTNDLADAFTRDSWLMRPLWLKIVVRISGETRGLLARLLSVFKRVMK